MDLRSMTAQLREGAMSIERCMEQIEAGKRAEALLPDLINKQATLALSIKYWSERETDRAMPIEEFVDKLTEYMKEANKND
ncbi:MAG: hypothetical protein ACLVLI_01085 [Aedoeadaptatus pacaensis]